MPVAGHKLFVSMFKLPTQEENPGGLHGRYYVEKVNGEPVDENAEYFILRLDRNASNPYHLAACRRAIMAYANTIQPVLPVLAHDLFARYGTNDRLTMSRYMENVVHMLINIAGWNERAALNEMNNVQHWMDHYESGRSPLEGYKYDLNESSHHA